MHRIPFVNFIFSRHEIWVQRGEVPAPPPMVVSRSNTSLGKEVHRSRILRVSRHALWVCMGTVHCLLLEERM